MTAPTDPATNRYLQARDAGGLPMTLPGNPDWHDSGWVASPTKCFDVIATEVDNKRIYVRRATMYNGAAASRVGLGPILASTKYAQGTIVPVTYAYTADPAPFPVSTLVDDTGFVFGCSEKFNVIAFAVGTARVVGGGGDTYIFEYWSGAAWTALTLIDTPSWASVATTYMTFAPPANWAKGGTPVATVPTTQYNIRCRATSAPGTTAAIVTSLTVARIEIITKVAATTAVDLLTLGNEPVIIGTGETLTAFWETASANSFVSWGGSRNK